MHKRKHLRLLGRGLASPLAPRGFRLGGLAFLSPKELEGEKKEPALVTLSSAWLVVVQCSLGDHWVPMEPRLLGRGEIVPAYSLMGQGGKCVYSRTLRGT